MPDSDHRISEDFFIPTVRAVDINLFPAFGFEDNHLPFSGHT
jgi:hypothetical protein